MQFKYLIFLALIFAAACDQKTSNESNPSKTKDSIAKIASRYGFQNFHQIDSLLFTFRVNHPNGSMARRWKWQPDRNRVTALSDTGNITFRRGELADSTLLRLDAQFVNDKYWLLFPFQMKWDRTQVKHDSSEKAPISGEHLKALKFTYPSKSGYTPGDSYTIYYDTTHTIQEWTYCPDNDCSKGRSYAWKKQEQHGPFTFTTLFENEAGTVNIVMEDLQVYIAE